MIPRRLIIGIDTGGTYTDAVIIDAHQHRILASAKAVTTKGDLAIGVSEALALASAKVQSEIAISDVKLVCVSTTLATNAVVEGHGAPAGAILIGFDEAMVEKTGIAKAFPGQPIIRVAGGHDHNGEAREPLDIVSLKAAIQASHADVSAFAIAGAFAVRNNAHEVAARELVAEVCGLPVTLSSELSSALDAPRRALTAVLNARLISRITHLIEAVQRSMLALNIDARLMIVRGDGTLATAEAVAARPIETVLSGPAASLVGAKWISGLDDFIMSDIGGTTTDVGVLLQGRPQVNLQGAEVGGWRTMVKAIDLRTVGLGGDSEVQFGTRGELVVGPQRAVPIALLAHRFPEVLDMLDGDLAESEGGSLLGKFLIGPFGAQVSIPSGLPDREQQVLEMIGPRPVSFRKVAVSSAAQRAISALRRKGLLQLCCFTPSDAACVLGLQGNWPAEASRKAAQLMVRFRDMKMPDETRMENFCREVWSKTVALSCRVVLETTFGAKDRDSEAWRAVCDGNGELGLGRVSLSPQLPIVAVGGPARVYYPEVGRRLHCDVVYAPHHEVANAVGAAAGVVADKVTLTVESDGNGCFRVNGLGASESFGSAVIALEAATAKAQSHALSMAVARGAVDPKVQIAIERTLLPESRSDDDLLVATVTAEAMGKPA